MASSTYRNVEHVRVVTVSPLSARQEALTLVLIIAIILGLMGLRFYLVRKNSPKGTQLQAYQEKDLFLRNQAPIMYRSLCSVAGDILDIYQEEGSWPTVERLEEEALPPFAKDFLPPGLKGYVWKRYPGKGWVDYFGINADVGRDSKKGFDPLKDSFVLRIIDLNGPKRPGPVLVGPKGQDGRFCWQVWIYPSPRDYPGAQNLIKSGWKWIVNATEMGAGTEVVAPR